MHQKIFILAFILIISSFIFFAMQFTSGSPSSSNFFIAMGLMMAGGILLAASKAKKFSMENETSFLDELINMVNKTPKMTSPLKPLLPKEKAIQISSFRKLLSESELEKCLKQMEQLFQREGNKASLREVTILQSRLKENDKKFLAGKISHEDMSIEKIKISYAINHLIEREIEII
ncbi:MAG: hypothetical protein H6573_20575 [Lewinellaceae bacterium]|nr:hypothetical protein [Lewinellaceae bacterium]